MGQAHFPLAFVRAGPWSGGVNTDCLFRGGALDGEIHPVPPDCNFAMIRNAYYRESDMVLVVLGFRTRIFIPA